MNGSPIRVLVVEDEPVAAAAHAAYVRRVPGFVVAGIAPTGAEALHHLTQGQVDLTLLDLNLPDLPGLDVCRAVRASGRMVDVIAVTSARDLAMVRRAVNQGVLQYLLKPFVFATLRDRLLQYQKYRDELIRSGTLATGQQQVDQLFSGARSVSESRLPKGMSSLSLEALISELRSAPAALSATEAGERVGLSRVSARRYLEYLCEVGMAARAARYAGSGRPEIEYSLRR